VLIERLNARAQRLAVAQAISQLNRVDERLLALFWHLAARWGHVTPRGLHLSLTLSHRMLSQLIGARRPTVSTALGDLTRRGQVLRLDDGTWLLTGEPVGTPAESTERFVPPRRRLLAREPSDVAPRAPVPDAAGEPLGAQELLARLERVRVDWERTRLQWETGVATAVALARTTTEQCERLVRLREPGGDLPAA
jgi:hypothetical protein